MIKKQTIINALFYIGYLCIIINSMMYRVIGIEKFLYVLNIVSYILLTFVIILSFDKFDKKSILFVLILLTISIISSKLSGDLLPIKFSFVILASKRIDFNKLIKNDMIVKILLVSIIVILHYLGMTNDYVIYRIDGTMRNSMGFSHPNIFGFHLMIIGLEYFYVKYINHKKVSLFDYVLLFTLLYIIDICSDSRSSILAIILFAILFLFRNGLKRKCDNNKVIFSILEYFFIILTVISLVSTIIYNNANEIFYNINKITSNRIFYNNYFYYKYGISLFGQQIITIGTEIARLNGINALVLDNVYIQLLIRYGLFMYLTFAYLFTKSIKYAYKNNDFYIFLILLVLITFGLMETSLIIIDVCPFLIYFSKIIYNDKKVSSNE